MFLSRCFDYKSDFLHQQALPRLYVHFLDPAGWKIFKPVFTIPLEVSQSIFVV